MSTNENEFNSIPFIFYSSPDEYQKSRSSEERSLEERFNANLVKWQSYPLKHPLLKLPQDLNALASECFECILRYCGDMPQDREFTEVKCVYSVLMVRNQTTIRDFDRNVKFRYIF